MAIVTHDVYMALPCLEIPFVCEYQLLMDSTVKGAVLT